LRYLENYFDENILNFLQLPLKRGMMKLTKILVTSVVALLIWTNAYAQELTKLMPNFIGQTGAQAQTAASPLRSLRFLTSLDFPPFSYIDASGNLSGFNVYLARLICADMNIESACTIQAVPFDELEGALKKGLGDAIIAGVASNIKAREQLAFTKSYMGFPARFVALTKNSNKIDFEKGLAGYKIGVVAGTGHEKLARSFFPRATIIGFASQALLTTDLNEAKLDLMFGDAMQLSFWLAGSTSNACCHIVGGNYYSERYMGEGMRIATDAIHPEITNALNQSLISLQRQGKFQEIYLRFFPNGFY
jgi:polar amino acid transport system substrate-binding protein